MDLIAIFMFLLGILLLIVFIDSKYSMYIAITILIIIIICSIMLNIKIQYIEYIETNNLKIEQNDIHVKSNKPVKYKIIITKSKYGLTIKDYEYIILN